MSNRMINTFIVISALSSLVANLAAISILIQTNAQREQTSIKASQERQIIKKQNDLVLCILQIQPTERDAPAVDKCRKS